jgi:hypothetical protein
MKRTLHVLSIFFTLYVSQVAAIDWLDLFIPRQLYLEPEIYHVHRTRDTGTHQNGFLYGVQASVERVKRHSLYWGVEGQYARGTLRGRTGTHEKIRSTFTDDWIEARIGYTIGRRKLCHFLITPFIGYGRFNEINHFKEPSPNLTKHRIYSDYFIAGFLSQISLSKRLQVGLEFKAKIMIDPKCRVSHDRVEKYNATQMIEHRVLYRIDLPISYRLCSDEGPWSLGVSPFFEYRNYGKHINFPADFHGTILQIYGIGFLIAYHL